MVVSARGYRSEGVRLSQWEHKSSSPSEYERIPVKCMFDITVLNAVGFALLRLAHGRAQKQLLVVSEVALPREVSHPSVRRAASLAKQNAPARVAGGRRPARSMPHVRLGAAEETKGGREGEGLRLERRGWRRARTDGRSGRRFRIDTSSKPMLWRSVGQS